MGILDRFRSAGKAADDVNNKAGTPEQDALRLIDEGRAHEALYLKGFEQHEGAMDCYRRAVEIRTEFHRPKSIWKMSYNSSVNCRALRRTAQPENLVMVGINKYFVGMYAAKQSIERGYPRYRSSKMTQAAPNDCG